MDSALFIGAREGGGMRWGWRIVLGFFAFLIVEQVMLAIADWQLTRPSALQAYIARADLRVVSDEEAKALGWPRMYQSCEYQRTVFLYHGLMCFLRVGDGDTEYIIDYWAPHSILNLDGIDGTYFLEARTRDHIWKVSLDRVLIGETY